MLLALPRKAIDLAFSAHGMGWDVAITTDVIEDNRYVYLVFVQDGQRVHVNFRDGVFLSSFLVNKNEKSKTTLRSSAVALRVMRDAAQPRRIHYVSSSY